MSDLKDFYTKVSDLLKSGGAISKIPEWIQDNTTLKGRPWSFKDHEFQLDIAGDMAYELDCMKCSQVGLSELQIRFTLAFLAIKTGFTGIYVLPNNKFAIKFAKGRIDPVIEGSKKLSSLIISAADSSEMKRLGLSTLYIGGASTETQAISIPADFLVEDEYDFCNPNILGKYESRLRHAENGGYRRRFSTPTLPGYGISLRYEQSSKGRYFCKCEHCEKWVIPDFHRDVFIPGFDDTFDKFDKEHLTDDTIDHENAYIRCQNCHKSLDSSLADPSRRRWVHEWESKSRRGYAVKPFDLIKYNPTVSVIKQIENYDNRQDYENFVHGNPYKSKFTEIDVSVVRSNAVEDEAFEGSGLYAGIDVGKTVFVTLGYKRGTKYFFVKFAKFKTKDENLLSSLVAMLKSFGVYRTVIDSQPDYSLCQGLKEHFGEYVSPCVYINDSPKKPKYLELKDSDEDDMVHVQRTKGLDGLVRVINEGKVNFCKSELLGEVIEHYGGMKRVEELNDDGERKARWRKISDRDHFFHSSLYCKAAIDMDEVEETTQSSVAPVRVLGANISSVLKNGPEMGVSAKDLVRMYGY